MDNFFVKQNQCGTGGDVVSFLNMCTYVTMWLFAKF